MSSPLASVIILTRNLPKVVVSCLDALAELIVKPLLNACSLETSVPWNCFPNSQATI
jgi:hypothetical protein